MPGAQPGMGQPGMQPGMGQPGMGQPGMGQPGMGQPGMGQPGMGQPGMGQPGQEGATGPKMGFNVGSGGVRLNYQGGDFSVEAMKAAVFEGQGFAKPRFMGAAFLGLAVVFIAGNVALIKVLNRYYPYLYGLAAIFLVGGLWLAIIGQPAKSADGTPAPMWGRIGLGACLAVGLLLGIAMITLNWEFLMF